MRTGIAVLCAVVLLTVVSELAVSGTCNIVNGKRYGDCVGVTVNTRPGPFRVIKGYVTEHGIIDGAAVRTGASLTLYGISTREVTVQKRGRFTVYGIVKGNVQNSGGRVAVHGIVEGSIISSGGHVSVHGIVEGQLVGRAKYHLQKGSVINGVPQK